MLLKKTMVLKARNYSHLQTAQDYDLWFRLIQLGEIRIINKPLIKYRVTSNSVSDINREKWDDLNFTFFKKYSRDFFIKYDEYKLNKLWRALSPHFSKNKKMDLKSKEFLNYIYSFCNKNDIKIFNLLKNKIMIKQFLSLQNSILSYNFILFTIAILLENRKYLDKITD